MELIWLLLKRASVLVEAYQKFYEGRGEEAEERGSYLIECAGEAIVEVLRIIDSGAYK